MSVLFALVLIATHFAGQREPLKIVTPQAVYQLGPSTVVDSDDGVYSHELIVSDANQRTVDRIRWNDHAERFDSGFVYKNKILLIGDIGGSGQALSVLDINTKKNILFVLCRTPAVSPSHRYVGYLQFKPRNLDATLDDIVLVLDLDNVPSIEPSNAGWVVDSTNVGTSIYPSKYVGKTQFYVAPIDDGTAPILITSLLSWNSKLEVLKFVSKENSRSFEISADLTPGVAQPAIMRKDAATKVPVPMSH
jgi:hypothetical protein